MRKEEREDKERKEREERERQRSVSSTTTSAGMSVIAGSNGVVSTIGCSGTATTGPTEEEDKLRGTSNHLHPAQQKTSNLNDKTCVSQI